MTTRRRLVAAVAVTTAIAMSAVGAITARAGDRAESPANQIAGSWDVTIDRTEPLSDLKSLQSVTDDGSTIEIAAGTALHSPSHGAWERLAGRRYASTAVFFRYDPQSSAYLGTQKIVSTLTLSPDGASYSGVAVSKLYDPAENVVLAGLRADISGVRVHVEVAD